MKNDMYCTSEKRNCNTGAKAKCAKVKCRHYKHKWPTFAQFQKEYGKEVPDDMPVWIRTQGDFEVKADFSLGYVPKESKVKAQKSIHLFLLACTPYGRLPADYQPEAT